MKNLDSAIVVLRSRHFLAQLCFYTFICALCVIYYIYHSSNTIWLTQFSSKSIPTPPLKPKLIHFATNWWNTPFPYTNETKSKCPECDFNHNPGQFEVSDAVVFHCVDIFGKIPPVERRQPNQIWVLVILESESIVNPWSTWISSYDGMFNWTMTYRLDSDVPMPYGRFVQFSESRLPKRDEQWAFIASGSEENNPNFMKIPTLEQIKGKKMAAWIVTNCATSSGREALVNQLSKFIPIDIYGKCGNLNCTSERILESSVDCKLQISDGYKFYLAFENSLCEDYVTEKYFDTLLTQMVPVVYGGANYSRLFPHKSFINVLDFPTLEKLADYLKYLDGNDSEYLKYFDWRKEYWVMNNAFVEGYCSLCRKLWSNDPHRTTKSYNNIIEWWTRRSDFNISGQDACFRPHPIISRLIPTTTTP